MVVEGRGVRAGERTGCSVERDEGWRKEKRAYCDLPAPLATFSMSAARWETFRLGLGARGALR